MLTLEETKDHIIIRENLQEEIILLVNQLVTTFLSKIWKS